MPLDLATTPPPTPSNPTLSSPDSTAPSKSNNLDTKTLTINTTSTPPDTPCTVESSTPYWPTQHTRTTSYSSVAHVRRAPIALEDHEGLLPPDESLALWARSVRVVDYAVVDGGPGGGLLGVRQGLLGWGAGAVAAGSGGATAGAPGAGAGAGAYVVWRCVVQTLEGGDMVINKRYSEFASLRDKLIQTFPHSQQAMPELPRKSMISKFRQTFLEKRREGLEYFLNCVLLNPEFAGAPVLKEFLFS